MAQVQTEMQAVTKYPPGTFSWIDLSTTDPEAAKKFYTGLFGWEYEDMPIGDGVNYTMFSLNGKNVAAVSGLLPHEREQGIPPHWNSYITVDDIDKSTAAAKVAGGTVLFEPMDVFDSGRMSGILDPAGAVIMFWQPINHIGASYVNYPNTFVWNELAVRDVDKAVEFYTTVLGWTTRVDEMSSGGTYTTFVNGERNAAGLMEITPEWGDDVPPHWTVYFLVEEFDAAAKKLQELGGTIVHGPVDMPGFMKFAVVHDPQGAHFSLIQMEKVDPPPQG